MRQMIEMKQMKNIREIEIEAERVTKTGRVIETKRVMNIQLIVYRIAQAIEMTGKILKNGIELFLIDECRGFLMMNHCRDFLVEKIDDCRGFLIFLKFLEMMIEAFPEFLIEVKMKMIVSGNFLL